MSKVRKFTINCFMFIFGFVVQSYTYLTLPIYYLLQKPNKKLQLCSFERSKQIEPNDPYSPWVRVNEPKFHVVTTATTLAEAYQMSKTLYDRNRHAIGYRNIIEEKIIIDKEGNDVRLDGKVLRQFLLSDYNWLTYEQVYERIDFLEKGLLENGIRSGDKIVILAETCAETLMFWVSLANIGVVWVSVFATLGDEGIIYAINETKSKIIYTTYDLLPKVFNIFKRCPQLSTVIYVEPHIESNKNDSRHPSPEGIRLIPFSQLISDGRNVCQHPEVRLVSSDEIQMICYTSGTTGQPKGVCLTARQIIKAGTATTPAMEKFMTNPEDHTYVAYLPQSHSLEASVEIYAFVGGVKIGFATPFTLNESAPGLSPGQVCDLRLLKPTIFVTVPLVLDRMKKEIYNKLRVRTPVSPSIFTYLIKYKTHWTQKGYETPLVNRLLCPKVKVQFGGKLEHIVVGGAPLSPQVQALIKAALNVSLVQGYGLTETFGAVICMDDYDLPYGRCGAPLKDIQIKLIDWIEGGYKVTDKPNPRGEIVVGGYGVANGYYDNSDLTQLSFTSEESGLQWFSTGDIGEVFPDGTFKIIDRKKDLIKLANGEYFSLGKIESSLKNCSYVDNICVIGDMFVNYLVALVMPNMNALKILSQDIKHTDLSAQEMCSDRKIIETIYESIVETALEQNLNRKEIPTKIKICHEEWSPDNGMLTAAMKLKRHNILIKYKEDIKQMLT